MPCLRSHDNQISELGFLRPQPWSVLPKPRPQTARMGGAWEAHRHRLITPLRPTRVCKYLFFYHVRIFFFLTPDNAKMVFKAHTAPRVREPHPGGGRVQGAPAQRTGRPPPLPIPAHSQHSTPRDTSTEPPPSCNNSGASAPPRCRGQLLRFYIL